MFGWFKRCSVVFAGTVGFASLALVSVFPALAGATAVTDEATFTAAWQNAAETQIDLSNDVTLTCTSGEPTRNSASAIVVNGNGHVLTQTCASDRVMEQQGTGTITLTSITVTGGAGAGGGALDTAGNVVVTNSTLTGNNSTAEGGAIQTNGSGTVTITNSTISNNTSQGSGGAIGAQGLTTIINSTLSGNNSTNNGGAVRAYGGAVVINSTLSNNTAASGGGAIDSNQGISLTYATIVDNTATGGGNLDVGGTLNSFGSVIALPHGSTNCVGVTATVTSGYNVDDDGSCGFGAGPGDQSNLATALGLAALADNGGPAQTRLPDPASPLVDQIPGAACGAGQSNITDDERGVLRPQNTLCDIGAVEVAPQVTTTTTTSTTTTVVDTTVPTTEPPSTAPVAVLVRPAFTG